MTKYDQYLKFCEENTDISEHRFFLRLAEKFECSYNTAANIWYIEQRSRFEPEMIDEMIRMDKNNESHDIMNDKWENGRFVSAR